MLAAQNITWKTLYLIWSAEHDCTETKKNTNRGIQGDRFKSETIPTWGNLRKGPVQISEQLKRRHEKIHNEISPKDGKKINEKIATLPNGTACRRRLRIENIAPVKEGRLGLV